MKYSCIQDGSFNFTLDYRDNHLIYTDHSKWLERSDMNKEYLLRINNEDSFKEFTVLPNMSIIIPYTELPSYCGNDCNFDGIYNFTAVSCENSQEFSKTEAILLSICKVYDKIVKNTVSCEKERENMLKIFSYMEIIRVFAKENNVEKAVEFYNILLKIIKKLNCKCDEWNMQVY